MTSKNGASVVIVGGGVTGLSAGWWLARAGHDVIVLDKGVVGWEASSRNGGGASHYQSPLFQEEQRLWPLMDDLLGYPTEYRRERVIVAMTEKQLHHYHYMAAMCGELGFRADHIDSQTAQELVPLVDETCLGGIHLKFGGHANPQRTVQAYAWALQDLGGRILQNTVVTGFTMAGGQVTEVLTTRGALACDALVVAAGPQSGMLLDKIGVRLPLASARAEMIVTEPAPVMPIGGVDGNGLYGRQTLRGNLAYGGGPHEWIDMDETGPAARPSTPLLRNLSRRVAQLLPKAANLRVIRSWAGVIENTPDGRPVIDRLDDPGNVTVATMSGVGFGLSPASGHAIADLVIDGKCSFTDLEKLSLKRFADLPEDWRSQRGWNPIALPPKAPSPMADDLKTLKRPASRNDDHDLIAELDKKVHWLSAWTIHNANHLRESRDGLKVGGHQASSASLATVMSALYFSVLRPEDRIAVKPHASPVFHAIQYLYGRQSLDQIQRFRSFGGAQSYPSRTKDQDDVDFSTGSVGLGVAMSAFASITQDYMLAHGRMDPGKQGRMISLLGDGELDEGNIYECLIEGAKHDLRNTWWIVDYNRQSLDATTWDSMFLRFADIFAAVGWDVVTLKYGRKLEAAFKKPGGEALRAWIDGCPNDLFAALSFQGGAAWRARLTTDLGDERGIKALLADHDDDALATLMTNLAGHDLELLLDTFHAVKDQRPKLFILYTIKGFGLPFQGHKDNHSGLMTPTQMETFQTRMGVPAGQEWEIFAGLPREAAEYRAFLDAAPFNQRAKDHPIAPMIAVPDATRFPRPTGRQSTQVAFGKIMNDLARAGGPLADALVTTSPDVTVSTNLGGFVNQRGLFAREPRGDQFKDSNIASPQKWLMGPAGQHIELGIAENNLFLMLGALGLAGELFGGQRLIPVGTLYDPFINRGLDALNYACYQDARFMLVATPAGLTLAPEGGAHQSIHTPLIGMAQDKLAYFEPAFVDELVEIMRWGFDHLQRPDGSSVYLRLSTRALDQPARALSGGQIDDLLAGAYWLVEPAPGAEFALVYTGAIAAEAREAFDQVLEDIPGAGLLAVTSPDRLHLNWSAALTARARGDRTTAHIERLLAPLAPDAGLATVIDGPPATLSWLGGVRGHRVAPLGMDHFGQSGDLPDLYRAYRLDSEAILDAAAAALLPA